MPRTYILGISTVQSPVATKLDKACVHLTFRYFPLNSLLCKGVVKFDISGRACEVETVNLISKLIFMGKVLIAPLSGRSFFKNCLH